MSDESIKAVTRKLTNRLGRGAQRGVVVAVAALTLLCGPAHADPDDPPGPPFEKPSPADTPVPALPVFTPHPSKWQPSHRYPYDETQQKVTGADINSVREMCQWFNAEYKDLSRQIDAFGFNLLHANNDWTVYQIQNQADAVTANIDQTEAFLTPRAQALTQSQDFAGDVYFPVDQGESFYRLWQMFANVGTGIKARNTAWIYGPVVQREKHWGSRIERSHTCDGA